MILGAAYYPEQHPRDRWAEDASRMQAAGLRYVRMAEHAWTRLEPVPGTVCFDWLDECIGLLRAHGLDVILCTPTACPPPWLWSDDLALVNREGVRLEHGSRHSYCPNHPGFRAAAEAITRAMAAHFAATPGVIAWQIDNELGIVDSHFCCCERCRALFRDWLRSRYGDLDALNAAWGTAFWGHTYTAWSQIPSARRSTMSGSPGLLLDYARFASERIADFARSQAALLRAANPDWTITHNLWNPLNPIHDVSPLVDALDVVSLGAYPTLGKLAPGAALMYDCARAAKGAPFWNLELQARSALNWQGVAPISRPGQMRLWTAQACARGAERATFWAWQTSPSGAEQYWHGVIGHDNRENRFSDEVRLAAQDAVELEQALAGTTIAAEVALLNDADSRMAWESVLKPNADLKWSDVCFAFYHALLRNGITADVIGRTTHLEDYRLVVAPLLYCVDEALAARLRAYVAAGGVLVTTFSSGAVTPGNVQWGVNPLLPPLGIEPRECDPRALDNPILLAAASGERDHGHAWAEAFDLAGGTPLARYAEDYLAGRPAIAHVALGSGALFYFGTLPGNLKRWMADVCTAAGVSTTPALPEGVELVRRRGAGRTVHVILNHNAHPVPRADLPGGSLRFGAWLDDSLAPYGVLVVDA